VINGHTHKEYTYNKIYILTFYISDPRYITQIAKLKDKRDKIMFCPFTVVKCVVKGVVTIVIKFVVNAEYYDVSEEN
jgi:hypothetical protein